MSAPYNQNRITLPSSNITEIFRTKIHGKNTPTFKVKKSLNLETT